MCEAIKNRHINLNLFIILIILLGAEEEWGSYNSQIENYFGEGGEKGRPSAEAAREERKEKRVEAC